MSLFRHRSDESPENPRRRAGRRGSKTEGDRATGRRNDGGDAQEQVIIDALNDLRDMPVREVMTPRVDVVALPLPLTVDAVSRAVRESGHSAFPVFLEDLDHLVGVLFVNDLFRAGWMVGREDAPKTENGTLAAGAGAADTAATVERADPGPIDLSRRLRQPFLVPESRPVLDVLAELRRQRRGFAVVVDEYGGVEGVLTVKDLLGALVGDLADEFDRDEEPDVVRVDRKRWLVDGRTSVDDVQDELGIQIPEGEYVTLGGFLFDAFGHIPTEGERVSVDDWELRIAEMDKRRIAKVVAKRLHPAPVGGPGRAELPDPGTSSSG